MKTTFLSVVCLFCLAATSFSQDHRNESRKVSSTGLFQTDKPVTLLHGQRAAINCASINGGSKLMDLEKTYRASSYADLAKGEFGSIVSVLQQPALPVQK